MNSNDDIFAKIEKLYKLKEEGVITEEEFKNSKRELLKKFLKMINDLKKQILIKQKIIIQVKNILKTY